MDGAKKSGLRPRISAKILIYFVIVALLPLIVVSSILVSSARTQLLQTSIVSQQTIATDTSHRVDDYLTSTAGLLTFTGNLYASNPTQLDQSLQALFKQNPDLQKIDVVTTDHKRRSATLVGQNIQFSSAKIDSDDTTLDQLSTKSKILSVDRDNNNAPTITLGVPITKEQDSSDKKLFLGGIIATYKVGDSWKSILTGKDSIIYLVDASGNLIYHPDSNFLFTNADVHDIQAVQNFMGGNHATGQTSSESKQQVVSTSLTTASGWGVIVEQSIASIYGGIDFYVQFGMMVAVIAIIFSTFVILIFRRQITHPIKQLVTGARQLNKGDFTRKIDVRTNDELQELAEAFNSMSGNINGLVSDLKTNNENLSTEQTKLRSIINNVNDGVVAVNSSGEIISVNPPAAKLINQIPHALPGKQIANMYPWTRDGNAFRIDLYETGIRTYDNIMLAGGESVAYLDLMVEVIEHDDNGIAAIITIHDQTASRELSFMKLDFVAIAAHELRTPLTVISGYLDMLNTEAAKELSIFNLESLQKAIVGANQLRELINKLLNIARIERGDMEIFIEKLNLSQLVNKNVEQHQQVAAQKDQKLTFSVNTHSSVYVPADTASIVEVLNNLIGNALKYTPKGGTIQVNIVAGPTEARVEVLDSGPGVPEDLREKLFTKFYRAERSLISGSRGTGLGLFISKTIIDLQHGTIGIKPDGGPGSKFYFTLPTYDPARDDQLVAKNISGGIHGWFKKRSNH